jgi:predicted nucleotidyltransferase
VAATLSPLEVEVLGAFRERLRARFGERLAALTLFGSRARGEGHAESDLDVLVLVRDLVPAERRAILDVAYDLELDTRLVLAPIVRDPRSFRFDSALGAEIARDGVAL